MSVAYDIGIEEQVALEPANISLVIGAILGKPEIMNKEQLLRGLSLIQSRTERLSERLYAHLSNTPVHYQTDICRPERYFLLCWQDLSVRSLDQD